MKLNTLLREIGAAPRARDAEISNVTDRIEEVRPGSLFVCVRGRRTDGGRFAAEAFRRGAAAVIAESPPPGSGAICAENARRSFALLCAAFFGRPDRALGLVGVTGTNGKTATVCYLRHILEACGHKTAAIGTLGVSVGGRSFETGYTTPPGDVFFRALAEAAKAGCAYCAAEVSSQALDQHRTDGARFRLGVFTNLSAEHLDYHGDLASLARAKARLCGMSERFLVNADDPYAGYFLKAAGTRAMRYSMRRADGEFLGRVLGEEPTGVRFELCSGGDAGEVLAPAPGLFTAYNVLAACAAALALGLPFRQVAGGANTLPRLPGRMELVFARGVRICVDFAHTPAALGAALGALRKGTQGNLIAVFGCGGDRDRNKRPLMGAIAAEQADLTVLTSDNPRGEDPLAIIAEIRAGMPPAAAVLTEPDRGAAIAQALSRAKPGDTVLIAGKGHENVQWIGGEARPFDDMQTVRALLAQPEATEES